MSTHLGLYGTFRFVGKKLERRKAGAKKQRLNIKREKVGDKRDIVRIYPRKRWIGP